MNKQLSQDYSAAVGSLMAARRQYEDVCKAQGAESWAAEQAREYMDREIEHRDQMRKLYDKASGVRVEE